MKCRMVENAIHDGLVEAFGDDVGADRCWTTAQAIAEGLGLSAFTMSGLDDLLASTSHPTSDDES